MQAERYAQDPHLVLPRPWCEPRRVHLLVLEDVVKILWPGDGNWTGWMPTEGAGPAAAHG